jgi:hypothetical protein
MARLVQSLECQAGGNGPIADHRDDPEVISLDVPCGDHAERG